MMRVEIIRCEYSDKGIFGIMKLNGECFCVTLELPWYSNIEMISAIPYGQYKCKRVNSPSHGEVWEIQNVPKRMYVQIHAGNTMHDTLGCILLAQYCGKLRGNRAVLNSGVTFKEFMSITRNEPELSLSIIDA